MAGERGGANVRRAARFQTPKPIQPESFSGIPKIDFAPTYVEETLQRARRDYAAFEAGETTWLDENLRLLLIAIKRLRVPNASTPRTPEDIDALQQGAILGAGVVHAAIDGHAFERDWCNGNLMRWNVAERGLDCRELVYEEDISRVYSDRITEELMQIGTDAARTACFLTVSVSLMSA